MSYFKWKCKSLPRILPLVENNQTESGIKIPKVLQGYTRFNIID